MLTAHLMYSVRPVITPPSMLRPYFRIPCMIFNIYLVHDVEDSDETGGHGGAIFTDLGSTTVFERRTSMRSNRGASGGALYNMGTTILESAGFIRDNQALVRK